MEVPLQCGEEMFIRTLLAAGQSCYPRGAAINESQNRLQQAPYIFRQLQLSTLCSYFPSPHLVCLSKLAKK